MLDRILIGCAKTVAVALIGAVAILAPERSWAATWWVAEDGNDETGDGSQAQPFATLSKALSRASSEVRDTIRIADGTYSAPVDRFVIDKAVEIAGNDEDPRAVIIDGEGKNPFALLNHADVFIHGIRVYRLKLAGDIRTSVAGAEQFSATPFEIVQGVVSNCVMEDCSGLFAGGISVQNYDTAKVYDTVITGITSQDMGSPAYGGGLRVYGGLVQNCVVSNNTCTRGAGAYVKRGTVRGCRFVGNVSKCTTGAGVYMIGGTLEDCVIVSNQTASTGVGGGVYMEGGTIRNSLVAFNGSGMGAGIYIEKGSPVVQNCTVAKNVASVSGDGIYMKAGSVVNTAVDGEEGGSIVQSAGSVTYSCSMSLEDDAAGTHNVHALPGFRNADIGDFTLVGASPCIDSGSELDWHAGRTDVSGETPRLIDGKGQGIATVDIGACEYDPSNAPLAVSFAVAFTSTGEFPQSVTLAPCVEGASGEITAVMWDFGDGTTDTTLPLQEITHDYAKAGYFTVKLTITVNGVATPLVSEMKDAVKIKPTTVYIAKGKSATPPYDTLEKATESLDDALAALSIPSIGRAKVIVADGTYAAPSQRKFLESPIEIVGNDADPNAVTFDGANANPFALLNHADAFIHGIRVYRLKLAGDIRTSISGADQFSATPFEVVQGVVSNCVMENCSGMFAGGISVQNYDTAKVYDTVITGITSQDMGSPAYGGGLRIYGGLVQNCVVSNNTCTRGAGAYVKRGTVRGCRFVGNVSKCSTGAGVYMIGGTLENCVIVSNQTSSTGVGGGVYMEAGTIRNSLVAFNTSGTGAGIYLNSGTPAVQNCTVAKNVASASGDGIYMKAGSVVNTAVDGEEGSSIVQSAGSVTYSCSMSLEDDAAGTHNVHALPGFRNADSGDFTLAGASPCVDAGCELDWHEDRTDVSGENSRLIDGKGQGFATVDIGAYEYDPSKSPAGVSFSVAFTPSGSFPQTVFLTPSVQGNVGEITSIEWDFGDGKTDTALPLQAIAHEYESAGYYTVKLTVTASGVAGSLVSEMPDAVKLKPTTVYLAKGKSATHPYDTLEKATENIDDALSALAVPANGRGRIIVADGTYAAPSSRKIIESAFEIAGNDANPRAVTFDGENARAFMLLNHDDAFVHGIRLYRAKIGDVRWSFEECPDFSCSPFEVMKGVVSNCVMESCFGYFAGGISVQNNDSAKVYDTVISGITTGDHGTPGYGGGLRVYGGLVQNCVISNCACSRGAGAYVKRGLVRGCLITGNTGVDCHSGAGLYLEGGTVENCVIVSNTTIATGNGGGVYQVGGTLRGALVVANTAGNAAGLYQVGGSAVNVTIADNTSPTSAGAEVAGTLVNSIVVGKGEYDSANPPLVITGAGTVSHCCSPSLTAADCISDDPRLRNRRCGDYRLRVGSPCINFGDNDIWLGVENPKDMLGQPRILEKIVDLGCYEKLGCGLMLFIK